MLNLAAESVRVFGSLSARLAGGRILAVQGGQPCIIDEVTFGKAGEIGEDGAGGIAHLELSDRDFILAADDYAFAGLQAIPADGDRFVVCDPDHQAEIAAVNQATPAFVLGGDRRGDFRAGAAAAVVDSTANDGVYSVAAAGPTYDAGTDRTIVPVEEAIPNAEADGMLQGHCDLYEAAPIQGDECYRSSDPQGIRIRIHTKRIKHV